MGKKLTGGIVLKDMSITGEQTVQVVFGQKMSHLLQPKT